MTAPAGPRFYIPFPQVANAAGVPYPGALLGFFLTGSSTRAATYSDAALTTPNTNPVVADDTGTFPAIFLNPAITYKAVLTDAGADEIWTADPVLEAWFLANAIYVDIPFEFLGGVPPVTSEVMGAYRFLRACTFPANWDGTSLGLKAASGACKAAPSTGNFVITVYKNASPVGTITVAQTTGVFTFATSGGGVVNFAVDDDMTFVAQSGLDASFANAWWTLTGTVN